MNIEEYADQLYHEVLNLQPNIIKKREYQLANKFFSLLITSLEQLQFIEALFKKRGDVTAMIVNLFPISPLPRNVHHKASGISDTLCLRSHQNSSDTF